MKSNISVAALRAIAPAFGLLIVVIAVSLFTANFLWGRIGSLRAELESAQREENALATKLSSLQGAAATVTGFSEEAVIALPPKNSSLLVLSQMKRKAVETGVSLQNVKAGTEIKGEGKLVRAEVIADVDGSFASVLGFLKEMYSVAPLSSLEKVRITDSGGGISRANVRLSAYWSPFPTKLPTISEPLPDLSADEQAIIAQISTLEPPIFIELAPQAPQTGRENPFSL